MKVYKDDRGSHDLEVQIERLQIRVRELEEINETWDASDIDQYIKVDEIKPSMQSTALNKVFAPMTDRIYSDDEHGNSL